MDSHGQNSAKDVESEFVKVFGKLRQRIGILLLGLGQKKCAPVQAPELGDFDLLAVAYPLSVLELLIT